MEPSLQDRLAVASALILQSPPGEVNDVFNDLRPIVGDDNELETGLLPALSQYNTEQFTLVDLPNAKMPAMVCPAARLDTSPSNESEPRYLDPNSRQTFVFDHLRLVASEVEKFSIEDDDPNEKVRSELSQEAEEYVKSHYQDAFCSVFSSSSSKQIPQDSSVVNDSAEEDQTQVEPTDQPEASKDDPIDQESIHPSTSDQMEKDATEADQMKEDATEADQMKEDATEADRMKEDATEADLSSDSLSPPQQSQPSTNQTETPEQIYRLYIVGNKYNPSNYWTGRWRSSYEINMKSGQVKGLIQVNVHYYEQGNVQLSTNYEPVIDLPSMESTSTTKKASQILKAIEQTESKYQNSLNAAYADLGDNTFKQLRRALPVTKQKINWNNIKSRIVLNDN